MCTYLPPPPPLPPSHVQAGSDAPHTPTHVTGDGARGVHFTPLRSLATGAGAGLTRAVSRTLTFPLDTLKTRSQLSKLGAQDRAALPEVILPVRCKTRV